MPLDQAQRLDAALRAAGVETKLIVLPDQGHGFKPNLKDVSGEIDDFLKRHLKP